VAQLKLLIPGMRSFTGLAGLHGRCRGLIEGITARCPTSE